MIAWTIPTAMSGAQAFQPKTAFSCSAIWAAFRNEAVSFPWQSGDVLLLDNMQVAHARRAYTGERKVVAALLEPYSERIAEEGAHVLYHSGSEDRATNILHVSFPPSIYADASTKTRSKRISFCGLSSTRGIRGSLQDLTMISQLGVDQTIRENEVF